MNDNNLEALISAINENASLTRASARALKPSVYRDAKLWSLERTAILFKEWFCVGRATDFKENGDYFAFRYAGEPVIVWRGSDDEIRAFSNVCRHRATVIKDAGAGNAKVISCPYHAWTYNQDGTLRAAPHTPSDFDTSDVCLPQFKVEVWQGFVFINLDENAKPLAPVLRGIEDIVGAVDLGSFQFSARFGSENVRANWKAMLENGLDGYHVFAVHKQTLATNVERVSSPEGGDGWSPSCEPRGDRWESYDDDPEALTDHLRETTYTFGIFPTLLVSIDCHSLVYFALFPNEAGETTLHTGAAARTIDRLRPVGGPENTSPEEFSEWVWALLREDFDVVARLQSGSASRFATQGRLAPDLEDNLVDFHRYLARMLGPSAAERHAAE